MVVKRKRRLFLPRALFCKVTKILAQHSWQVEGDGETKELKRVQEQCPPSTRSRDLMAASVSVSEKVSKGRK